MVKLSYKTNGGVHVEIETILKEFYNITGFRVSIYDANFNEIHAYPKQLSPYCTIIQNDKKNKLKCIENDQKAFLKVKNTGELELYRCSHGLYEAVAPIYHYGILSGYFMIGQVCENKEKNYQKLYNSVYEITKNDTISLEVVDTVKEVPDNMIQSYVTIMSVLANYITKSNILPTRNNNLASLILEYLQQNYASKISLNDLARLFFCSQSTLVKTFKAEYQTTIISKLNDIRIEKAAELLTKSTFSIKEIASQCGYEDQNYFSKVFYNKYHMSPSSYRNTHYFL